MGAGLLACRRRVLFQVLKQRGGPLFQDRCQIRETGGEPSQLRLRGRDVLIQPVRVVHHEAVQHGNHGRHLLDAAHLGVEVGVDCGSRPHLSPRCASPVPVLHFLQELTFFLEFRTLLGLSEMVPRFQKVGDGILVDPPPVFITVT